MVTWVIYGRAVCYDLGQMPETPTPTPDDDTHPDKNSPAPEVPVQSGSPDDEMEMRRKLREYMRFAFLAFVVASLLGMMMFIAWFPPNPEQRRLRDSLDSLSKSVRQMESETKAVDKSIADLEGMLKKAAATNVSNAILLEEISKLKT
jgi:hypothetical protein